MNGSNILRYDSRVLKEAMHRKGFTFLALGKAASVSDKTAKTIVMTGRGQPDKVFLVAKALGFDVKLDDFSAIMKNGKRRSA